MSGAAIPSSTSCARQCTAMRSPRPERPARPRKSSRRRPARRRRPGSGRGRQRRDQAGGSWDRSRDGARPGDGGLVSGQGRARHLPERHAPRRGAAGDPRGLSQVVNELDSVESNALDYLVAMDLQDFEVHFALGTDHPRVGWSEHMQTRSATRNCPARTGSAPMHPWRATAW